jgi:hypothetical protein
MTTDCSSRSLLANFFQLGYVTRDVDHAIAGLREHGRSAEFQIIPAEAGYTEVRRIALTWTGATMIELIEPDPAVRSVYIESLPQSDGAIALHHLGFLTDDFQATLQRLESEGFGVPMRMSYGDVLDCCYADARAQFGHYLEYVRLGEQGRTWFESVPGYRPTPADVWKA